MNNNEISKKELLEITGISYGQLYRWKRKGLIPEDWFIKKASFTGQETYFPEALILERIDKILELKDIKSLEEISDIISGSGSNKTITKEAILKENIFIHNSLTNYLDEGHNDLNDLVLLKVIDNIMSHVPDQGEVEQFMDYLKNMKDEIIEFKYILVCNYTSKLEAFFIKDTVEIEYNVNYTLKIDLETIINNLKLIFM